MRLLTLGIRLTPEANSKTPATTLRRDPHPESVLPSPSLHSAGATLEGSLAGTQAPRDCISHGVGSACTTEKIPEGLGEINEHTRGAEFYGSTGTFYFLSRLRYQANLQMRKDKDPTVGVTQIADTDEPSIVNLLHSSEYSIVDENSEISQNHTSPQGSREPLPIHHRAFGNTHLDTSYGPSAKGFEIERECVRLYFENLHCIHPILDPSAFIGRCENVAWRYDGSRGESPPQKERARVRWIALLNAVMALGAITAGETSMLTWNSSVELLKRAEQDNPTSSVALYPPIRFARLYFERSKYCLDDIFESSSFETVQTLFLLVCIDTLTETFEHSSVP